MKRRLLPGQSLIEMLVVLCIISLGLYAGITLIFSNVMLQEQDADQTIAMNLAREMLEFTQNKRDSNWLAGSKSFDDGLLVDNLTPKTDCTAVPAWDGTTVADPFFNFTPNTLSQGQVYRSNYSPSLDLFTNHKFSATSTPTDFYRLLTFAPICQDPDDAELKAVADGLCACPPAGFPAYSKIIGVRAKAQVRWTRRERQQNLTIYGDFYDWR